MKCKNCGGELTFQNGIWLCQSCRTTFSLENIYENIDVYLCYEENDNAGRRTRDSIIAQEVYRKLEYNKITTFYERVSADGMIGSNLESSKLAAMNRAKVIVVLGTSAEVFAAIETKYSNYFNGKPVIPFCVDVNPGAIPKTLSKIQAMNYSSIGWENDLAKGICNILGRTQKVDILSPYPHRKRRAIIISAMIAVVIAIAFAIVMICPDGAQSKGTAELTEESSTQGELYEKAQDLLNEGKYLEAVEMFAQIIGYKDSSNQIKKIYDRYDGYYCDEKQVYSLYLNIVDGKTVEVSFEKKVNDKIIKIKEPAILDNNQIKFQYIDSLDNEGSFSATLSNKQIAVSVSTSKTKGELSVGEDSIAFLLISRSERPLIKDVTKETLLSWLSSPTSLDDIKLAGYELIPLKETTIHTPFTGQRYLIANTEIQIYLSQHDMSKYTGDSSNDPPELDKYPVVAIVAPINLICPERIGTKASVFAANNTIYVPKTSVCYICFGSLGFNAYSTSDLIEQDDYIGITSKKMAGEYNYNQILG